MLSSITHRAISFNFKERYSNFFWLYLCLSPSCPAKTWVSDSSVLISNHIEEKGKGMKLVKLIHPQFHIDLEVCYAENSQGRQCLRREWLNSLYLISPSLTCKVNWLQGYQPTTSCMRPNFRLLSYIPYFLLTLLLLVIEPITLEAWKCCFVLLIKRSELDINMIDKCEYQHQKW